MDKTLPRTSSLFLFFSIYSWYLNKSCQLLYCEEFKIFGCPTLFCQNLVCLLDLRFLYYLLLSSFSGCLIHQKWYECKPCRKLFCGDPQPFFCFSLLEICFGSGCYCEPGYLWSDKRYSCIPERKCYVGEEEAENYEADEEE